MKTPLTSTTHEWRIRDINPNQRSPQVRRVTVESHLDEHGTETIINRTDIGLSPTGVEIQPGEPIFKCPVTGLIDSLKYSFQCSDCRRVLHVTLLKKDLETEEEPIRRIDKEGVETIIPRRAKYCAACWKKKRLSRFLGLLAKIFIEPFATPKDGEAQ